MELGEKVRRRRSEEEGGEMIECGCVREIQIETTKVRERERM